MPDYIYIVVIDTGHTTEAQFLAALMGDDALALQHYISASQDMATLTVDPHVALLLVNEVVLGSDPAKNLRNFQRSFPHARTLVYGDNLNNARIRLVLNCGINGYLLKEELLASLPHTLRSIHANKVVYSLPIREILLNLHHR